MVELKDYRTGGRDIWTNGSTVRGRKPLEKSVAHERMRYRAEGSRDGLLQLSVLVKTRSGLLNW